VGDVEIAEEAAEELEIRVQLGEQILYASAIVFLEVLMGNTQLENAITIDIIQKPMTGQK
jgi:hypothetical protein